MKFSISLLALLLFAFPATAGNFEFDYYGSIRFAPGYIINDHAAHNVQSDFHMPLNGWIENSVGYVWDEDTNLTLFTRLSGESGSDLDHLNQGNWGEEATGLWASKYGELYVGQAQNAAVMLGVNRPNINIWQIQPAEMVNYLSNPNWQQKKSRKYYSTLNSTLINTDGSSFKLSYLSPEWQNTRLGLSYTPENNAKDGLSSKFAPYYDKSAWIISLQNYRYFNFGETNFYAAFADFTDSHREYAAGLSYYHKGWTLFASYRKTQTSDSDAKITTQTLSPNMPAYFDAFRNGYAWNAGMSLQFAYVSAIVSYFESAADDFDARNRFVNTHLSFKMHKNLSFYAGFGWSEFTAGKDFLAENNRGIYTYTGIEFNF